MMLWLHEDLLEGLELIKKKLKHFAITLPYLKLLTSAGKYGSYQNCQTKQIGNKIKFYNVKRVLSEYIVLRPVSI